MPSRLKSILFYTLILVAVAMIVLKIGHITHLFDIETVNIQSEKQADFRQLPPIDEENRRIQADLERQRREIDASAAELRALGAEIDVKLETLREAEENILRLLHEKENLAEELPRTADGIFDSLDEKPENSKDANELAEEPLSTPDEAFESMNETPEKVKDTEELTEELPHAPDEAFNFIEETAEDSKDIDETVSIELTSTDE